MSVRFGLDSTGPVSPAAHHAVGSTVALRYLSRYSWKVVTAKEYLDNLRNHIDTALVFEDGARNAWLGYDQGKADAEFALKQAIGILGHPAAAPEFCFAVDDDTAGNPGATDPYFDGVAAVLGREHSGGYGEAELVAHQYRRGFRRNWQTYAWSRGFFVGGVVSPVFQYSNGHNVGGQDTDFNHIYGDAWAIGAWNRSAPVPPDPHHYMRFPTGPFRWGKYRHLNERALVHEYDRLRPHSTLHAVRLRILRGELAALRDRIWVLSHDLGPAGFGNKPQTPDWHFAYRGWRFQQLAHRARGLRVV